MGLDPRTPVIVGAGQVNERLDNPELEPVDLMAMAAREAADRGCCKAVDAIRVVNLLSWRYRDPGLLLAAKIGAKAPATSYTGAGGNTPVAGESGLPGHPAGRTDVVLLAGAETWRTRKRLQNNGIRPHWTRQDDSVAVPPGAESEVPMAGPAEDHVGLLLPSHVYPMFRAGVADRQRREQRRAPPPDRRAVGPVQRGGRGQPARPGAGSRSRPRRSGSPARTTG